MEVNPFQIINGKINHLESILFRIEDKLSVLRKNDGIPTESNNRYISKKEAAEKAGVCVATIDNWRREEKIESKKFGHARRFHLGKLMEYLENQSN